MEIDKLLVAQVLAAIVFLLVCGVLCARFAIGELNKSRAVAYTVSLESVRSDALLAELVGDYIHRDWLFKGSPLPKPGSDVVDFEYSVVGARGRARVIVHAIVTGKAIQKIEIRVRSGKTAEFSIIPVPEK